MSQTQTQTRRGYSLNRPLDHLYDPLHTAHASNPNAAPAAPADILGKERIKYFKRPLVPFLHAVTVRPPGATGTAAPVAGADPASTITAAVMAGGGGGQQSAAQLPGAPTGTAAPASQSIEIGGTRTVGTQSLYRESEAQTDPYTPDIATVPGEPEPEVLSIAHLSYGHGLPASQDEVTMILRAREKRAFEASLPPITDEASFEIRKQMLEARELQEWAMRGEEMKAELEARLQIMIDTLRAREDEKQRFIDARIDQLKAAKLEHRQEIYTQIHKDSVKMQRSIVKNGRYLEHKSHKRDIVGEHSDFGSKLYAPVTREGRLPVKNQVVDYGIPLISNYSGLTGLEASLPASVATAIVRQPAKIIPRGLASRKGQKIVNDLAYVNQLLEDAAANAEANGGLTDSFELTNKKKGTIGSGMAQGTIVPHKPAKPVIQNVYKKFEPIVRAQTPQVEAFDDEPERAILLLQRLIRGRAVQNSMYEGKQKSLTLIRELRLEESGGATDANAEDGTAGESDPAGALLNNSIDTLQGELISNALDFISKEMVRVAEERHIAALVKQAGWTRRVREAEESGRRQAEHLLRLKQHHHYQAVMDVHSECADRFLDSVLDSAVDTLSTREAVTHATLTSAVVHSLVDRVEADAATRRSAATNAQFVARDLVSAFVLPEVERRRIKRNEDVASRRYVFAAHKAMIHAVRQAFLPHKVAIEQQQQAVDAITRAATDAASGLESARSQLSQRSNTANDTAATTTAAAGTDSALNSARSTTSNGDPIPSAAAAAVGAAVSVAISTPTKATGGSLTVSPVSAASSPALSSQSGSPS